MARTYRALAALLSYPTPELPTTLPTCWKMRR